jgi:predicted DNA repair protein MutK
MAGSLLLLLDDIASTLDDVATVTKVAVGKTAGVIGDDLALNAKQVAGVAPDAELAVVAAVACGSAVNKLILVPVAMVLARVAPWAVEPLLLVGGLFLCYEGVEKLFHGLVHRRRHPADESAAPPTGSDRKARINDAIRTDFILSAEIIVITLGVVAGMPWTVQFGVLAAVAVAMTVIVYGAVAAIVKLDDLGLRLASSRRGWARSLGAAIVAAAPVLLRCLSVAGTAAMFLVGGGIVAHAVPALHHLLGDLAGRLAGDGPWRALVDWLGGGAAGLGAGIAAFALVSAVRGAWRLRGGVGA